MITFKETLLLFQALPAPEFLPKCLACGIPLPHRECAARGRLAVRYCINYFFHPIPKTSTLPKGLQPDRRIIR